MTLTSTFKKGGPGNGNKHEVENYSFVLTPEEYEKLLSGEPIKKFTADSKYNKIWFTLTCKTELRDKDHDDT